MNPSASPNVSSMPTAVNLAAGFSSVAAMHPERLAVGTVSEHLTYRHLDISSSRVAHALLSCRQAPGEADPVALLLHHGASLVAAILGTLKAGRPYVVLDPADAPARRRALLAECGNPAVLTDEDHRAAAETCGAGRIVVLPAILNNAALPEAPALAAPLDNPAACITFTSGTTGTPRGIVQSHRALLHHCRSYCRLAGLSPEHRIALVNSLAVAASHSSFWSALLSGAALLPFALRHLGIQALAEWLHAERITLLHCVPTVFRALCQAQGLNLEHLRLLRLGGETILPTDLALFEKHTHASCRLCVALSSTETGATCMRLYGHGDRVTGPRVALGRPTPETRVLICDESHRAVPAGQTGRIVVQSRHLALGYWGNPQETARRFVPAAHDPELREFDTGDLGRFNEQDELEHCGRADDQLKIRGQRVSPSEVDAALLAIPGMRHALCMGHGQGDGQLIAYIDADCPLDDAALRARLRQVLGDHMVPAVFVRIAEFPRTANGKIDRRALPPPPSPDQTPPRRVYLSDPLELKLAAIWSAILGRSDIDREDHFFDTLAGTSLQAAEVVAQIQRQFQKTLAVSALMQSPTIRELARLLAPDFLPVSDSPLLALKAGTRTPLFLFHAGQGGLYTYRNLLARLHPQQAVFGLQCAGMQGERWPTATIPAMARRYLREIVAVQPQGPYRFAGTCMGGLIALESAAQLQARGQAVELLATFETTHPAFGGKRNRFRQKITDAINHRFRVLRWAMLFGIDRATGKGLHLIDPAASRRFVSRVNVVARHRHRPPVFQGTMDVFVARQCHAPQALEIRLAMCRHSGMPPRIHDLPGPYDQIMLPPAVDIIAATLQRLLDGGGGAS